MENLFLTLFVVFGVISSSTSIYIKILLRVNKQKVLYFYTGISDYKNLWRLSKKQKSLKLLFFINIISTALAIIPVILIMLID